MERKEVSKIMLTLLLTSMLTLAFKIELVSAVEYPAPTDLRENEPVYVGVAKYYDNRKSVVTSTQDDFPYDISSNEKCLSMLTEKKIYNTVAIVTNWSKSNDWEFIQYWVNQGYTEAGSHSRNHVHAPYTGNDPYNGRPRISYEWQINGSKNDIIGNLTLPDWWRSGEKEYVYAWIEPFGSSDSTVKQWLGDCYYLAERKVGGGTYDFAGWDSTNELFNRVGYTVEMGAPPWGGDTSVSSLNAKFDFAYNNGKIYHLMTHPAHVNWSEGGYADQHTDYISNRTDVWYVPFGLLYLYHWVDVRNVTDVTATGNGQNKIFKIKINETDHENYGISYPITYMFDVPSKWEKAFVYYRYRETDPWILMLSKSSEDLFNGITASRFNFTDHKAYVSVGFSNVSHEIHLQLRYSSIGISDVAVINVMPVWNQMYPAWLSLDITVTVLNNDTKPATFKVTVYYENVTTSYKVETQNVTSLPSGSQLNLTFSWNLAEVSLGLYAIKAKAVFIGDVNPDNDEFVDGTVKVTLVNGKVSVIIPGDIDVDGDVDPDDFYIFAGAYGTSPPSNPYCDLDGDNDIDPDDFYIFAGNYGKTV